MNRREFVKALAGIPLLGLLVRLPQSQDEPECVGYADDEGWLYIADPDSHWTKENHTVHTRPYEDGEPWPVGSLVITYQESTGQYLQGIWNGKEWERRLADTLDVCNIV